MMKAMEKLLLLTLILLLALSGGAFAEASDPPSEEIVLVADLAAFKERGELFEGITPGMSLENVLNAGLPLNADTWVVGMLSEESMLFDSPENCVVTMEGIRLTAWEGMGTFSCLFKSDALASIHLYPGRELLLEDVLPLLTNVLGEPFKHSIVENEYMSWDFSRHTYESIDVIWEFNLADEVIWFSASAQDYGDGATLNYFSATYRNYLANADESE